MRRERSPFKRRQGEQDIFRTISAGRSNALFEIVSDFLFALSSYPSHIVEIFMRKRFGERYFTSITSIVTAIIMLWIWFFTDKFGLSVLGFTWLPFIIVILFQSIRHRREIKKFGTTYNFDRYSYCDGFTHPYLVDLIGQKIGGMTITKYRLYTLIEPGIPVIIGIILAFIPFTRGIGILIFVSGLCFGFRNFMKAHYARSFILDMIDEQISMAAKYDVLVEEKPKSETKGISFPIDMPDSKDIREEISKSMDKKDPKDLWDYETDKKKDEEEEKAA